MLKKTQSQVKQHQEDIQFVGRRPDDRKETLVKNVDEVELRLQQKRNAAESRKRQRKEEREKVPDPKWTQEQMNYFVIKHFGLASIGDGAGELTMRDIKRMTKQSDVLIRNALKEFGIVVRNFPTHVYVLRDEFKINTKPVAAPEEVEQFEFESE